MRDPRIDPRPGDVLMKRGSVRAVRGISVSGEYLLCDDQSAADYVSGLRNWELVTPWMWQWRKWAADAEVIHQEDDQIDL